MAVALRCIRIEDYDLLIALWEASAGVGLNESDTCEAIDIFLRRNPDMSLLIESDGQVIGAVLCGHDGRRGYLHHLAVAAAHRGQGLGKWLVAECLKRLSASGIQKCNIFLYNDNDAGKQFWLHNGWSPRNDLKVLFKMTS